MTKVYKFESNAPGTIKEAWKDDNGSLIIKSNDGDMVVVPKKMMSLFLRVVRKQ